MTIEPSQAPPSGVLFDQWSRYAALAHGVQAIAPEGGTVLDVGSGGSMLLGRFLPGLRVTYLDPLLAGHDEPNVLGMPLDEAHVADGSYDVVACVDVLEHVPAAEREAFLAQLVRASRLGVVLAAPFADVGDARATDDHVHLAYRTKTGHDYSWLKEHDEFGLPEFAATRAAFERAGLGVASFGNGHTPWLKELLANHVLMLDERAHLPALREAGDRFAADLMQYDHLEPTYRQVLVARRGRAPDLDPPSNGPEVRAAADAAWQQFRRWLDARMARHADQLVATMARQARLLGGDKIDELESEIDRARAAEKHALHELKKLREAAIVHQREACNAQQHVESMQASLSWRLTAPLRATFRLMLRARAATLQVGQWLLTHLVPKRLRWPLKAAFFAVLRPLLRSSREFREFEDARRWRQRAPAPPPPTVPDAQPGRCDIVVLGVIDWNLRTQRPQHFATELARRGHRVFYFTPGFHHDAEPGYALEHVVPSLPIYQVRLHTPERASIYDDSPTGPAAEQLLQGMRRCFADVRLDVNLCLVDHPGWVDFAAGMPRSCVVYDCMDNHHGFAESGTALVRTEQRLLDACDAVIATSDYIEADLRPRHRHVGMVRNACDPSHFAPIPDVAKSARPVIGYFGAVAQWFDVTLIRQVAAAMPDCDFLIVGADTADVERRLGAAPNVRFVGEVTYEELPQHVAAMHVLLIPFVIDELTLATNPVKAYEALAAGRPVVATEMPELMQTDLAPFVRTATTATGIAQQLRAALTDALDPARVAAMRAYAAGQTWAARTADVLALVASAPKARVGVVVVSWNGLALTRRCVASVLDDPLADDVDVVIVDNASTDDTPAWLDEIERDPRVRVLRNAENRGFGAACNQGLAAAATAERRPELLVILNNDIVVTPGWTATLRRHLRRDPTIGLIGPVTNNIGNEAKVDTHYEHLEDMPREQLALTGGAAGHAFDIPICAFFCVAMPLDVYDAVGGLDENFGTGFFEDDDYCQRVRALGRRIVCAEDVFVHHELSASFAKVDQGERQRLFERNKLYYESKWGPWRPHEYRPRRSPKGVTAG